MEPEVSSPFNFNSLLVSVHAAHRDSQALHKGTSEKTSYEYRPAVFPVCLHTRVPVTHMHKGRPDLHLDTLSRQECHDGLTLRVQGKRQMSSPC